MPYSKDIIGDYLCGFMSDKSIIYNIFTVSWESLRIRQRLSALFVDYKQTYDSVNRERLWNAFITFRKPAKRVRMIKLCMNKTRC